MFAVLVTLLVDKFVCLFNGYLVTPTNGGNQKNKQTSSSKIGCLHHLGFDFHRTQSV